MAHRLRFGTGGSGAARASWQHGQAVTGASPGLFSVEAEQDLTEAGTASAPSGPRLGLYDDNPNR